MKLISLIKAIVPLLVWGVFRPLLRLVPIKLLYKLATITAVIAYFINRNAKAVIIEELKKLFDDKSLSELKEITYKSFVIYYKRQAENLVLDKLDKEMTDKLVNIEGIENLQLALSGGRGAIVMVAHFGSQLLVPLALAHSGHRVNQLTTTPHRKNAPNRVYHIVANIRKKDYVRLPFSFLSGQDSLYKIFRLLKNEELIVIALDGREGKKWVPVRMFNKRAMLLPGIVKISEYSNAPIVPAFVIRQSDDTHRLYFEKPISIEKEEKEDEMLANNLQKVADVFECYIRNFPCHYATNLLMMRRNYRNGIIDFPLIMDDNADTLEEG